MKRGWQLLALATAFGACQGRELTVFDISAGAPSAGTAVGGSAGNEGALGGGGSGGSAGVSPSGGSGTGGGGAGGSTPAAGEGGDSSPPGDGPPPCAEDVDCGSGWVCEKFGCDAPLGVCVPWPALCPNDPRPVCGCDGVTYWNDCIRLHSVAHPQLASFDQCRSTAYRCNVGTDCNVPYASCSHLMAPGQLCGHGTGSCWVLPPPPCQPSSDKKLWRECRPPDQGLPPPFCVDTCQAIASERPHVELRRSDTCN
jgi:Kazal-type serine protease inhibitor domain